eukprot:m.736798 g.736798  ORF g.736798 m.736798 type:complete len:499 (+) comp58900_c0_seq4:85-1581(+)
MSAQSQTRTRTVANGPTMGIIAKPTSRIPPDFLVLESRRVEDQRQASLAEVKFNQKTLLRNQFEAAADTQTARSAAIRSAERSRQSRQASLESRQAKLHALLEAENLVYIEEIASSAETQLDRQTRMRERARQLREAREQERDALVEAKRYQHWAENCEELRTVKSKRELELVAVDRVQQIQEKQAIQQRKAYVEKLFDEQWEAGKRAKDERAERDEQAQRSRNAEQKEILDDQLARLNVIKQEEAAIKTAAVQLRLDEEALVKEEARRAEELRRQRQIESRLDLDRFNKRSLELRARDMQEEMAIDMKLIEDALAAAKNEAKEAIEIKAQFAKEAQLYLQYLSDVRAHRKDRDRHLDAWHQAEQDRVWAKQLEKWKAEKDARDRLMAEVIQVRRDQVHAKILANEAERLLNIQERKKASEQLQAYEQEDAVRSAQEHEARKDYQRDLLQQADANQQKRAAERQAEVDFERDLKDKADAETARVNDLMSNFRLTSRRP